MIDANLIERFFNKDCTPAEACEVVKYLNEHPGMLDKYLGPADWNNTAPVQMDEAFWENMWREIRIKRKPSARKLWLKRIAATAAIILVVIVGYRALYPDAVHFKADSKKSKVTSSEQKLRLNTTDKAVTIDLPDSSSVILSPGSVITYQEPFHDKKRNVQLEGEARFRVKQETKRPFTVYAGGLATTALGTDFTIDTRSSGGNSVRVKLHTGKVVVTQAAVAKKSWTEDVYLYPGQQLEYNASRSTARVSRFNEEKKLPVQKVLSDKKDPQPVDVAGKLRFTGAPLSEAIPKIESFFRVRITFDSAELSDKNFTGTISKSDSPDIILKVIAQMNELELRKEDGRFILKKQP